MRKRMPAIFVGHGSPMNAIETNKYTEAWKAIGEKYRPKGILMISGHWYVEGLYVQDVVEPKKIDDMYGFPKALYDLKYPVVGDKDLTKAVQEVLGDNVHINNDWGIDHGTWSVLAHMYPEANIPVVQLSVDRTRSPEEQYEIGEKLINLRDEGYMIMASGNVVHNLGRLSFEMEEGFEWAITFDNIIEAAIQDWNHEKCIRYNQLGETARLSVPSPDHYYPLLAVLGATSKEEQITVFNKGTLMGGISMTSYLFE